jgi:transposase
MGVSWLAVQTALTAALLVLPEVCDTVVTRLGIDEHRYRSVRYFRTPTSGWRRFEPGGTSRLRGRMSTIVDVTTGQVLGVVDGRDSAGVGAWLQARPTSWLDQVEVVAIVPREREVPPPSAAFRKLLLRGADTLSEHGWDRLEQVLRTDDPTCELGAVWGIKEQLRRLLKTTTLADAHEAKMLLGHYVQVADMPETDRLSNTICVWWTEIEVLIVTGVTNARTEAANTGIKHLKRTGRGFRNSDNYRARTLLTSAARRAA